VYRFTWHSATSAKSLVVIGPMILFLGKESGKYSHGRCELKSTRHRMMQQELK
jgi:hypothetical protein